MFCAIVSLLGVGGSGVLACGASTFSANDNEDASASDSQADSGSDGAPALDGAVVDGDADAASPNFCQALSAAPYLCLDFDEGNVLRDFKNGIPGVASKTTTGSGMVLQQSGGLSLPNVLDTTIDESNTGAKALISVADLTASPTTTHFRLDLDFRIDNLGNITSTQEVSFFSVTLANAGGSASTQYAAIFHAGTFAVRISGATETNLTLGGASATNTWRHATFDFQLPSNTFSAVIDGVTMTEISGNTAATETVPTVVIGLAAVAGGTPAAGISYDNVTLVADNASADGG